MPTRKSEDGVTQVSKEHLLALHASRRKAGTDKAPESQAIDTPTVQPSDGVGQLAGGEPAGSMEADDTDVVSSSQAPAEVTGPQEVSGKPALLDQEQTAATPSEAPAPEKRVEITTISFDEGTQIRERVLKRASRSATCNYSYKK